MTTTPDTAAIEAFLAPLAKIARKSPAIEGLVFWGGEGGWDPHPTEALEAEEIAFYAEGLLLDGFRMEWSLVSDAGGGDEGRHLRLCFWQDGEAPPAPPPAVWRVDMVARWP